MRLMKYFFVNQSVTTGAAGGRPVWVRNTALHRLYENSVFSETEELKDKDITKYEYFLSRNVHAIYGISITNNEGSIIGFIIIEFVDKNRIDFAQVEYCLHYKKIKKETILAIS